MDRRTFIGAVSLGSFAMALNATAQQAHRIWRIGYLGTVPLVDPAVARIYEAFMLALQERGYVEGKNLVVERRFFGR